MEADYVNSELGNKCGVPECYSQWDFSSDDGIKLCKYHYYYLSPTPQRLMKYLKYGSRLTNKAFSGTHGRGNNKLHSIEITSKDWKIGTKLITPQKEKKRKP